MKLLDFNQAARLIGARDVLQGELAALDAPEGGFAIHVDGGRLPDDIAVVCKPAVPCSIELAIRGIEGELVELGVEI